MAVNLTRRHLLVAGASIGAASCAGVRQNSPFWSTVTNNRPQKGSDDIRAYAAALPYASMLFWFDGQAQSLIVLNRMETADRFVWSTAEKVAITTFGPFIVATAGTDVELRETRFGDGWSADVRALVGKRLTRTTVSAQRGKETTARLDSHFNDAGMTEVKVLDVVTPVRRIDETVVANGRVRLSNSYWIDDATGASVKSRQQAIATMSPINTALLKAPKA